MFDYNNCTTTPDIMRSSFYQGQPSVYSSNFHNAPASKFLDVRSGRLPARRYSISGSVPLSSMVDYCNLSENAANLYKHSANLTNLLNETTKSLSRSSNILNMRCVPPSTVTHTLPGAIGSNNNGNSCPLTALFPPSSSQPVPPPQSTIPSSAGSVFDPSPSISLERIAASAASTVMGFTCSYPNAGSSAKLPSAIDNSSNLSYYNHLQHMQPNVQPSQQLTLQHQHQPPEALHHFGGYHPSNEYLLSKPIYSNTTLSGTTNPFSSQTHSVLSQTRNVLSQHYASNPTITRSLTNLPSCTTSVYNCELPKLRPSFDYPHCYPNYDNSVSSVLFKYPSYQAPYSKLDLEYGKTDMKRQVSFKFDVDTLSIDS